MDQSYDLPDKPTLWPAAVHRFLLETSFYPLVFCTSLCFAFLAARTYVRQELGYAFLVKNLFLAWVPYFLSLMAIHLHRLRPTSRWRLGIVWSAWLVMFPNAPYIFTDLIHLNLSKFPRRTCVTKPSTNLERRPCSCAVCISPRPPRLTSSRS